MSGAVGSMPSLTRNGRPSSSFRSSSPFGSTSTALRVRSATPIAASLLPDGVELLDFDRLELVCGLEARNLRQEREMRLARTFAVLGLAEPVAFACEGDVRIWDAAALQGFDDHLGLRGQHDLVVQALQQQKWIGDRVGVSDRGTVAIQIDRFRPRPNEIFVVVRLELVRLRVDGPEIC